MNEQEKRDAIVAEAMTWLRTPFHHEARVKRAGVDCANLLIATYAAVGLVPDVKPAHYPADFMFHQKEEKFLSYLLQYARPVEDGKAGDIAMFRFGKSASHGSLVLEWPTIIHAYMPEGAVVLSDATKGKLSGRFAGFYRLKEFE